MRKWFRAIIAWAKNLFTRKTTMRRKINLYIGDQLADLDDQSFILFNYQMDDLANPTVVKNSFSQQITLKGTPRNNKIFGSYYKADRRLTYNGDSTGTDFDASRKVPFTVYNELSEILESGYVKLESVSKRGADIQYKITLYGGLGSFFYSLSYDENGNKRTLADLDYMQTGSPESELDFVINANAVKEAWDRMNGDTAKPAKWDIINFAPAYNGIPEGDFAPNKALVTPGTVGLAGSLNKDGVLYGTKSGYALVNLSEAQDEWAVKDLRSYLQRPVVSMRAFWNAICNPENNGGYQVDASAVLDTSKFGYHYSNLWMTLPMITSISTNKRKTGDVSLTMSTAATTGNSIGRFDLSGTLPSGTNVTADLHCKVRFNMPSEASAYSTLAPYATFEFTQNTLVKFSVIFLQAVAYASDGTAVGGSKIKMYTYGPWFDRKGIADQCGFVPDYPAEYGGLPISNFAKVANNVWEIPGEVSFQVEAQDVAYYKIMMHVYSGRKDFAMSYSGNGDISTPDMFADYQESYTPTGTHIASGETADIVSYTLPESLRSGAYITKAMLLSTTRTPAEYMLSFCKMFGLYFNFDPATKKVTILRRNDLYQDETIDLSRRIDLSKGISITPIVFSAKWYDFMLDGVGGAFYDEYTKVEGIPYGMQRVDTGYDFNAETVNLMESVVFKTAATILARSKYFNMIFNGVNFQPSPFLDKGNTYTLWSDAGETLDTDISCPPDSATVEYYNDNEDFHGYDINEARKLELRAADGKPLDGSDILVFQEGWNEYPYFKLTDDVPAMDVLNEGVPCWLLDAGDGEDNALRIPIFQGYIYRRYTVETSMDFGVPRQLDIPGVIYDPTSTIYERGWRKYMEDRYDVNTKVMTCQVNFAGMQVNQELLRKFYWYDNTLWVLNSIKNYSLTTFDPVECEFVQVQDKDNYLNGQNY